MLRKGIKIASVVQNGHFTEGVDFAYWWSCIETGLRMQPVQQAYFTKDGSLTELIN